MLTVLEGSSFLVADDLGNVCGGTDGLYCDDVRALSRWRVLVDGSEPTLLTAGARDHASAAVFAQHHGGSPSHPSRVAVMRELFVSRDSLQERLVVENGARSPRPVVVSYEFDADFLDIFEVKSLVFGERDLTFAKRITPLYTARDYDARERVFRFSTGGDGFACTSLIWFSQPGIPGDREVHFEIEVPARGRWELACNVVVLSGEKARDGAYTTTYFEDERTRVRESLKRWLRDAPTLDGGVERVGHVYRKSLDDLAALRMHPPGKAESALPAAGLPWFMTVFGRDSLITSFQSMPIDDSFARAALQTLGAMQAHADDPERDAEPGKILHEMRFGKVAALTGQFPYYGSVDATPLYLIVLSELWRWTRDDAIVVELEPIAAPRAGLDGRARRSRRRRLPRVPPALGARPRGAVLEGLLGLDAVPRRHAGALAAGGRGGAGLRLRRARAHGRARARGLERPGPRRPARARRRRAAGALRRAVLGRARRPRLLRARARRRQAPRRRAHVEHGAPALHRHRPAGAHPGDRARDA